MENLNMVIILSVVFVILLASYVMQFGLTIDLNAPLAIFGGQSNQQQDNTGDSQSSEKALPRTLETKDASNQPTVPLQVTTKTNTTNTTTEAVEEVELNTTLGLVNGEVEREVNPGGVERIDFVLE
ncbi:MAG: hypothetical protein JXB14_06465 [Candidatus Altiarchaeota archaeon]|nr:hypothetical protein [Candidatus Altiarchaeota archaeon]